MPAKNKRPTMAEALNGEDRGGLLAMFERAALTPGGSLGADLEVRALPIEQIDANVHQARQAFDLASLQELAASIQEHGIIEPIVVRPEGDRYEIVAGERRHRAARIAGHTTIPARIMTLSREQAAILTALENLQREDLDIEDEARQFAYLLSLTGLSQRKLADKLGVNYNYLSRRVRLLKRPDLLDDYQAGKRKLHEALALLDQPETQDEVVAAGTVSLGHNTEQLEGGEGTSQDPEEAFHLVEREDLPGFIVSRGHSPAREGGSRPREQAAPAFRWRPAMQFRNWLSRTSVATIPPDERASFRVQIAEIKARLDEWEKELATSTPVSDGGEVSTQPEGELAAAEGSEQQEAEQPADS